MCAVIVELQWRSAASSGKLGLIPVQLQLLLLQPQCAVFTLEIKLHLELPSKKHRPATSHRSAPATYYPPIYPRFLFKKTQAESMATVGDPGRSGCLLLPPSLRLVCIQQSDKHTHTSTHKSQTYLIIRVMLLIITGNASLSSFLRRQYSPLSLSSLWFLLVLLGVRNYSTSSAERR